MTPIYYSGLDLFEYARNHPESLLVVTTNASVRKDGKLVMGRGAALQASKRFPWLQQSAGDTLIYKGRPSLYGFMRVLYTGTDPIYRADPPVGLFQVKYKWSDRASPALIGYSVIRMKEYAGDICMNFPGIGNGGLDPSVVYPILESLPNTVSIFQL